MKKYFWMLSAAVVIGALRIDHWMFYKNKIIQSFPETKSDILYCG